MIAQRHPTLRPDSVQTPYPGDLPARCLDWLASSRPRHEREHWRLGGRFARAAEVPVRQLLPDDPRPAAVLVALLPGEQGSDILLTVRAAQLRQHAGQIAFPGGRVEATDADPAAAALREAAEEVGLPAGDVRLLGFLPDHVVFSGWRITPVVGWVTRQPVLRHDPAEVAASFRLPLRVLLAGDHQVTVQRNLAGVQLPSVEIHYEGHRIWGATAGILGCLRSLLLNGEVT